MFEETDTFWGWYGYLDGCGLTEFADRVGEVQGKYLYHYESQTGISQTTCVRVVCRYCRAMIELRSFNDEKLNQHDNQAILEFFMLTPLDRLGISISWLGMPYGGS